MKNFKFRIGLLVVTVAIAAAGVLFSGPNGLSQIKIVTPTPAPNQTPVKIGLTAMELLEKRVTALSDQTIALEKQNAALQKQVAEMKTQIESSNAKFGSHTHSVNLNFTTLPSLGCNSCSATTQVLTYNKSTETTGVPIVK